MKITIEIPDETLCASITYVYAEDKKLFFGNQLIEAADLSNLIIIGSLEEKDGQTD